MTATVDDLPNEILAHFFRQCDLELLSIPCKLSQTPWVLSRVCSRWRGVALGTREIWNNLQVNYKRSWKKGTKKTKQHVVPEMFQEILLRSGIAPISLSLTSWTEESDAVTKFLVPHFHRVRGLNIREQFPMFLSMPSLSLPSLESIDLDEGVKAPLSAVGFSFLQNAPNLRTIGCGVGALGNSGDALLELVDQLLTLPTLSQVTVLHLPSVYLNQNEAVSLLLRCHSLVECQLRLTATGWSYLDAPPTHTLPFLETLHIDILSGDFKPFSNFQLPRLTSFTLSGDVTDTEWFLEPLGSANNLNVFMALDPTIIPLEVIESVLKLQPSLKVLHLACGNILSAPLLEHIASGILVPKLEILYCVVSAAGEELDLHLDMLESRQAEGSQATPLSRLILRVAEARQSKRVEKHPRVRQMKKDGLPIDIHRAA